MGIYVIKANGEREPYRQKKLELSLKRAGAPENLIQKIVSHIDSELHNGITTTEIYQHAFSLLKDRAQEPTAARYSLKRAVMQLGPSGFPFEKFLMHLFESQGLTAVTNVTLEGACTKHEIDVLAYDNTRVIIVEAKFHNTPGFKTDTKVALYVHARFDDIMKRGLPEYVKKGAKLEGWLITNTKFTHSAESYARCAGRAHLVSWTSPRGESLEDMIEKSGLHPLTCLTTLSHSNKQQLFDKGHVLCRSIKENEETLRSVGVTGHKLDEVMKEANMLCIPRESN